MLNFERPFNTADVALHEVDCRLKISETRMPCSRCKGALTFGVACFVKEKLTGARAVPNTNFTKAKKFQAAPATACWGIENCKDLCGLGNDKEAISAVFEACTGDYKNNLLFGSGEVVPLTLDHWRDMLNNAYKIIKSLRAELFKSRA
jgi:hypothetical protein